MTLNRFVGLTVILCLLALCTVHEVMRQTQAEYRIGDLLKQEEELQRDFDKLRAELAGLQNARLLDDPPPAAGELAPMDPVREVRVIDPVALQQ